MPQPNVIKLLFNQSLIIALLLIITAPVYNAYPLAAGAVVIKISFQFAPYSKAAEAHRVVSQT